MKVGYARVSTVEQNEARQYEMFKNEGIEKVFLDKMSGKDTNRPQLKEMLAFLREGDCLIVESISRLARSVRDLLSITDELNTKGITLVSKKENLDTSSPQGRFTLTIFGAMAELEREQILQRQREGIEIAKANGKYKGGRKRIDVPDNFSSVVKKWRNNEITAVEAMKRTGLKRGTFYKMVSSEGL